ncbi:NACHT domain-containing protein [Bradyrhizobium sp. BR 1433]|uniref:NACHT domain-containing protein n=1 Tax=Bradyrhizobium sp. BR 1433 TaxID=3447967 RepID=UPI003EE5CDEB
MVEPVVRKVNQKRITNSKELRKLRSAPSLRRAARRRSAYHDLVARTSGSGYQSSIERNSGTGCLSSSQSSIRCSFQTFRFNESNPMAESAGPSNQEGIFYQNSVAAQYLAELLSLQPIPPGERVVEVRVEAPVHVDDMVVRYADGHRDWIQAKSSLRQSGEPWGDLWKSFAAQAANRTFDPDDRLVIAIGRRTGLSDRLQALIDRASTSGSASELLARAGSDSARTYRAIEEVLPDPVSPFRLLRCTQLRVLPLEDIEAWFARLDLGTASAVPRPLLSNLRDMVGGAARLRGTFRALPLRIRLSQGFGTDLFEPREWGLAAYRGTLQRSARVEVPGKGISAPVRDLVVWPRARRRNAGPAQDFEDEIPRWESERGSGDVNLSRFPQSDLARCILVAGPGMGKSTLISALVAGLVNTPIIPVEIALGAFAAHGESVMEFLQGPINREYSVRVDWQRLADQGLICVFFDGLDEVATSRRGPLLRRISLFSSRFPDVPWLLTVRDPAALNGPLDGELLELQPFDNPEISSLVDKFKIWSPGLDRWNFTDDLKAYPDLARLARIPLFLSIMLASWSPNTLLPRKRADVIETYLGTLFDPDRQNHLLPTLTGTRLRQVAQALAFNSLEREEIGLSRRQALQAIALHADGPADAVLGQLVAAGVLRSASDGRLQFPYPVVQEYLAAAHLVDREADQIAVRIGDVVKRPWAQVLQFALELLADPTPHVRAMLDAQDDVFSTGLRLIGRCVANGAAVDPELRNDIGSRLARLWGESSYHIRERVGRMIVDAYADPLHPEVRKRLGWRWLLNSGAGEIISRAADPALTRAVVQQLFDRKLERFMNLHDFKNALQAIGSEIAARIATSARDPDITENVVEGLVEFLDQISLSGRRRATACSHRPRRRSSVVSATRCPGCDCRPAGREQSFDGQRRARGQRMESPAGGAESPRSVP